MTRERPNSVIAVLFFDNDGTPDQLDSATVPYDYAKFLLTSK